MQTTTDLHTHLLGMLSYNAFMIFLEEYGVKIPINKDGKVDYMSDDVKYYSPKEIKNRPDIKRQFMIPQGEKIDYDKMPTLYSNRSAAVSSIVSAGCKKLGIDLKDISNKDKVAGKVYGNYLSLALKELIDQGVEYVEISYSNYRVISNALANVNPKLLEKIKFNFLLSTDRINSVDDFKQSAKNLKKLLNNGCCVGFDVMGSEDPMSGSDIDPNSPTSMVKKLQPIITVLNEYENTTLRLHSGETKKSEKNTIEMLKAVKYIADKKNIKLPPPKIRIGHGIHIKQNKEYIKLLKELGCVVEINASSNFALKNVDSYDQIPYKFYLDNDIPIVISTDGHGMYDTTIRQELEHTRKVIGDEGVKKLISIEKKVKMG